MYVNTPGMRPYYAEDNNLLSGQNGVVGVVLEIYATPAATSFFPGPRCSVLLVDNLHIVRDVLIPPTGGGAAQNTQSAGVTPTDATLLTEIQTALAGDDLLPSPSSADSRWGSWVTVDRIGTGRYGQLVIGKYLWHPATATKRIPVVGTGTSPQEDSAVSAVSILSATPDELPDEISDPDLVPDGNPPQAYAKTAAQRNAWQAAYRTGWTAGAEAAYLGSVVITAETGAGAYSGIYQAAQSDGWKTGWADGEIVGRRVVESDPPERATIPATQTYTTDTTDAGDAELDGAYPAITSGNDLFIEHYGNRIVLYENGGIRIDSRAAGPIQIQGGDGGSRITAGGAIIDVGNGGNSVVVTADSVVLGGSGDRVILGYKFLTKYLGHTHFANGITTGKPDEQFQMDDVLTEKVVVK